MDRACPRSVESLSSLIKSTVTLVAGRFRFTALPPPEGVSDTPVMVTTKERMFVPAGGASGTAASVAVTPVVLPPPPPPPPVQSGHGLFSVQDVRKSVASKSDETQSKLLKRTIMDTPRQMALRLRSPNGKRRTPLGKESSAMGREEHSQNALRCSSAKGLKTSKMRNSRLSGGRDRGR